MGSFAGTGHLVRLALRRDRILIVANLISLALLVASSFKAAADMYPDADLRYRAGVYAESTMSIVAMYGHIYDLQSVGSLGSIKMLMFCVIWAAVLAIVIVRRHTRAEEESGRAELLGSTVVGRRAPLAAAVIVAALTSVALGALCALGAIGAGMDVAGSLALGLATAMAGLSWTGLAAVAVQLSSSTRTVGAWAFGSLGIAYFLRLVGDVQEGETLGFLTWLSPIGWAQQVRPYAGNRWWVAVFPVLAMAACLVAADRMMQRRDPGSGLFPERLGPAHGSLGSAWGLAWRLNRSAIFGWLLTFLLMGAVLGMLVDSIAGFLQGGQAEIMLRLMGGVGKLQDLYVSMMAGFMALGAAALGVACVLRLHNEEISNHSEQILATATTRQRYLASHALIGFAASALALLSFGIAIATSHAVSTGSWDSWGREVAAIAVHIPAVWVMVALALACLGWLPRWAVPLSWTLLLVFIVIGQFGELLRELFGFPDAVRYLSPFAHTPALPAASFAASPVLALLAVAAFATGLALMGYRRRDIATA